MSPASKSRLHRVEYDDIASGRIKVVGHLEADMEVDTCAIPKLFHKAVIIKPMKLTQAKLIGTLKKIADGKTGRFYPAPLTPQQYKDFYESQTQITTKEGQ